MTNTERNQKMEVMASEMITTYGMENEIVIAFCNEMEMKDVFNENASEERNVEIVEEMAQYKTYLEKYGI